MCSSQKLFEGCREVIINSTCSHHGWNKLKTNLWFWPIPSPNSGSMRDKPHIWALRKIKVKQTGPNLPYQLVAHGSTRRTLRYSLSKPCFQKAIRSKIKVPTQPRAITWFVKGLAEGHAIFVPTLILIYTNLKISRLRCFCQC